MHVQRPVQHGKFHLHNSLQAPITANKGNEDEWQGFIRVKCSEEGMAMNWDWVFLGGKDFRNYFQSYHPLCATLSNKACTKKTLSTPWCCETCIYMKITPRSPHVSAILWTLHISLKADLNCVHNIHHSGEAFIRSTYHLQKRVGHITPTQRVKPIAYC